MSLKVSIMGSNPKQLRFADYPVATVPCFDTRQEFGCELDVFDTTTEIERVHRETLSTMSHKLTALGGNLSLNYRRISIGKKENFTDGKRPRYKSLKS